ncbi:MAG: site-2 protease family protein [Chloroflexi bacterium]|nr:site-2 protease family protein [Chloroflexota bacterium]MCL5107347.1 site-2 protease family protein [Chloroflexota bacterium]
MRQWSWKLGRVAGIDVFVHATFLLIVLWVGFGGWLQDGSLQAALASVAFLLALFFTVLLHEFGHALVARRYGIKTRDVTLWPIGGVARLERMPDDPRQELAVALAGPLVSAGIAAALFVWLGLTGQSGPISGLSLTGVSFLERLMLANFILAIFNILPAFPMDGGRVLRALLALRGEYAQATRTAASIGQAMAFLFGLVGLFANPLLLFVAFFIWIGAAQEASQVEQKSTLAGIPVQRAMLSEYHTLARGDTLGRAVELVLAGSQHDFPVLEGSQVVGILTHRDLLRVLAQRGESGPVTAAMQADFLAVRPEETLDRVAQKLQECQCHTLPVVANGELVGLLTMDNVGEYLLIREALAKAKQVTGTIAGQTHGWGEGRA